MDDQAIDYHLVRIHREFYEGKEHVAVLFKLSEPFWKQALSHLASQTDVPKNTVFYNFEAQNGDKAGVKQSVLRFNVMLGNKKAPVLVAAGEDYLALNGTVRILFDCGEDFSADDAGKVFAEVSKRLNINTQIKPVSSEARQNLQKDLKDVSRESVSATNSTKKIHPEYEAEVFAVNVEALKEQGLHSIYASVSLGNLAAIAESGKMLSTVRRWSKGVLKNGMSSMQDLSTGGAESVFTRIHTKASAKEANFYHGTGKPVIIFPPDLVKRCDRYAFTSDKFGSKVPTIFDQRVSMEQLVKIMNNNYSTSNEVMFYDALSLDDAAYIVCDQPQEVIKELHAKGVSLIGGKPLNEAVITPEQFKSVTF